MKQFFSYLVTVNMARAAAMTGRDTSDDAEADSPPSMLEQIQEWTLPQGWTCPHTIEECWLKHSCWGLQLMWVMQTFLQSCTWPVEPESGLVPATLGFTWVELALAMVLEYGQWLPVRRPREDGQTYLFQPKNMDEVYQCGTSLGEQAWTASQIWTHYLSLVPEQMTPCLRKGKVRSLEVFGYNLKLSGVHLRPVFPLQKQVAAALQTYIPTATLLPGPSAKVSGKMGGLPTLSMSSSFEIWPEDQWLFGQPFDTQLKAAKRVQQMVRRTKLASV